MTLLLSLITFTSLVCVHGQQNDKGTSMIPFPRIGRADPRFFMEGKRSGNSLSPGLIPFPRIGRSDGMHESKRQLIPFPRVGKRPYWRVPVDSYPLEYEDYSFPMVEVPSVSMIGPEFGQGMSDETEAEKRMAGATGPSNNNNNGGMWFGPRLGRRKRSVESSSDSSVVDTRLLLNILHNFNWAIVPLKERRTFTPRLGRSSSEESPLRGISQRAEPYTPRLGRSSEGVSGGDYDEDSSVHRYSRNNNDNTRTQKNPKGQSEETNVGGVPFAPRLGRDNMIPRLGRDNMSPRLGRDNMSPRLGRDNMSPRLGRDNMSPRLGRDNMSPRLGRDNMSPRLGRDNMSPRLGRDNMSPRLGRDNISPRLGRSSDDDRE